MPAVPRPGARAADRVQVIVALGAFGYEATLAGARRRRRRAPRPARGSVHGSRCRPTPRHDPRLLPPEPAEHVHRQADRADARRGLPRTRSRARATTSAQELPDRVDDRDRCRARRHRRGAVARSDDRIVRCAPSRAPGITPTHSGNANAQSMWPSNAWVIVPGIASIPTHASDVPTAALMFRRTQPVNAGTIRIPPPTPSRPLSPPAREPDEREPPPLHAGRLRRGRPAGSRPSPGLASAEAPRRRPGRAASATARCGTR